jgi:hypothetical protein
MQTSPASACFQTFTATILWLKTKFHSYTARYQIIYLYATVFPRCTAEEHLV